VKVVRPPALVDYRSFEAPGKLGRTIGNLSVVVGAPGESLAVADVGFTGKTIAWIARNFDEAPGTLNLLPPELPSRRELVDRLRRTNPDLRVIWLPRLALHPLSWVARGAQRLLRPGKPAIDVAKVFAPQHYDNARSKPLAAEVEKWLDGKGPKEAPARRSTPPRRAPAWSETVRPRPRRSPGAKPGS
jgi:hypothetical protein